MRGNFLIIKYMRIENKNRQKLKMLAGIKKDPEGYLNSCLAFQVIVFVSNPIISICKKGINI